MDRHWGGAPGCNRPVYISTSAAEKTVVVPEVEVQEIFGEIYMIYDRVSIIFMAAANHYCHQPLSTQVEN